MNGNQSKAVQVNGIDLKYTFFNTPMKINDVIDILVVDNHPVAVVGYTILLERVNSISNFKIDGACNCDEVLALMSRKQNRFYSVVFLDIGLPPAVDGSFICGEDLGLKIRSKFPETKIIVHTTLKNRERLSNIYKSINPEGLLIKSDLVPKVLTEAIENVLNGHTYYSKSAKRILTDRTQSTFFLDPSDHKILYHLSKGERMKELPKYVPLAMATIERRKKRLKILFNVSEAGDRELLDTARAKGFI